MESSNKQLKIYDRIIPELLQRPSANNKRNPFSGSWTNNGEHQWQMRSPQPPPSLVLLLVLFGFATSFHNPNNSNPELLYFSHCFITLFPLSLYLLDWLWWEIKYIINVVRVKCIYISWMVVDSKRARSELRLQKYDDKQWPRLTIVSYWEYLE